MKELEDLYVIKRKTSSNNKKGSIEWKKGQKELIFQLYQSGMGYRAIGKLFSEPFHYNTIKRIVESFGGEIRSIQESRKNSSYNHNIFKTIDTEEKAYWLGFIEADGNVIDYRIKITLQQRDRQHLEKFSTFIGGERHIKDLTINGRNYSEICIFSQEMVKDLINKGCVKNKSLVLAPYTQIREDLLPAYIRGYWDGDGGISYSSKSNRWQAYCTSTKEMLDFFCEKMNLNTKPFLEHRCKFTYRIHFNGRINVYKKMNYLYENATIYLNRKYELYKKLQSTLQQ